MSKQQPNKFLDKLMNCYTEEELASYQDGKGAQIKLEPTHSGDNESKEPKVEESNEEKVKQPDLSVEQLENEMQRLKIQNNELISQLSVPAPTLPERPENTAAINKSIINMVFELAKVIPEITSSYTNNEVFNHLEHFDTYITTAKENSLYHDQLCVMSSFNKLAESHQIQCKLHFDVKSDWTKVKVPKYREWLDDYFKVYEAADTYRAILLNSSTKQTQSASQFYAYLCSLARQIEDSPQLQHNLQQCFVRGIHPEISLPVDQLYQRFTIGQKKRVQFLEKEDWNAFLYEVYRMDERYGFKKHKSVAEKRKFVARLLR
ncbi:hypothetical protein HDU92_000769 [Lobulomyces angularis]|nr:hypothetical protein HDU92_000769 [Lobulomyces angularis]